MLYLRSDLSRLGNARSLPTAAIHQSNNLRQEGGVARKFTFMMNEFSLPNAGEQTKEEKHSFILDMRRFFPRPSAVAVVEAAAALLIFGYVHIINPTGRPDRSSARRGNEEKTAAMMIGSSKWKAVSAAIEKQQTVDGVRGSLGGDRLDPIERSSIDSPERKRNAKK